MNTRYLKSAFALAAIVVAGHAAAQITFYEGEDFHGRTFATRQAAGDFTRNGFNDRASSVIVTNGRWEVCEDVNFRGRCVVLQRGNYDSLRSIGFNDRISSVRPFRGNRYAGDMPAPPPPAPIYEYRRRPEERVREIPVTNVREVLGPPGQRCWVERQQVQQPANSSGANVGSAILGGLVGGILGHQVGGGSGRDLATAAGAVGGAVVGNNLGGRYSQPGVVSTQDVQRCENTAGAPAYYEVTYSFRGQEHRVQMSTPPGATIAVNPNGEPRM
jgi:uncharacterized protein YcfJ